MRSLLLLGLGSLLTAHATQQPKPIASGLCSVLSRLEFLIPRNYQARHSAAWNSGTRKSETDLRTPPMFGYVRTRFSEFDLLKRV